MFKYKKLRRGIAILLLMATFAGCGNLQGSSTNASGNNGEDGLEYLETEPILDYTVPNVVPGILLNQIGYRPSSLKTVVVQGENLPKQFHIVDAETNETVYTGLLEELGYDNESGEYTSYGDFSDFAKEGTYYILCDIVGLSYSFVIKETLHEELMAEALQLLSDKRQNLTLQDVNDVCIGMSILLLSYELYGSVYDATVVEQTAPAMITELKSQAEWLLSLLDAEKGIILDGKEELVEQTAWVSAVLAKFSYTYQKYDSIYATACLQAADKAWSYLEKNTTQTPEELRFYTATELYRATGRYQYRSSAETIGREMDADVNNNAQLFGMLTYGFTKRKVNMDLCNTLLGEVFDEAEKIAQEDKEGYFVTEGSLTPKDMDDFLWDMLILSVVDYVITNSEYATLIERNHSYLAGENVEALCYIDSIEADMKANYGISAKCENIAGYIMILSEIMSHKQEE